MIEILKDINEMKVTVAVNVDVKSLPFGVILMSLFIRTYRAQG
jgi:hypothetical protein